MRLTLRLLSHDSQAPDNKKEKTFESFPIFIGRAASCNYVLEDISKYISSNHASIALENNQLILQDTSSNGVYINGAIEALGHGNSTPLTDGDSITVGDYCLSASVTVDAQTPDPFSDFGGKGSPAAQLEPTELDPFDPFRGEDHDWTPPSQQAPASATDNSPDEFIESAYEDSSDNLWADWDTPQSTPTPDQSSVGSSISKAGSNSPLPTDDFDWLPGTSDQTVSTPNPGIPRAASPPNNLTPHRPEPRQKGASPSLATGPVSSDVETLLRAAGLGHRLKVVGGEQQLMKNAGLVLRQSVEGLMQLLQSRAVLKNAIRTDVTMLSRGKNNALKFSATPEDALQALLEDSTQRGFLAGEVAVQQAIDDLKVHQLAMLDGMKAAVSAMLSQFDPDVLEKKLEQSNSIAANIPITREAKLWKLFQERFDEIEDEALEGFSEAFGEEFRIAYEKRIKELGRMPDG